MRPRPDFLIALAILLATPLISVAQEDPSLARLNASERHHEWVEVKVGERTVEVFVVFPETSGRVPAVLVIHENRGLNDWARSLADQVAEAGYLAVAPDLLSGLGPEGGKTSDFPDSNAARDALYTRTQEEVTADLAAVADWARTVPAADGSVAVAGFCWGGRQSFQFAADYPGLSAAFVFYGTPPEDDEAIGRVGCPVYGFYGGDDARVTATVEATIERMGAAGKEYVPVTYEGARHGFMRRGEAADSSEADRQGREQAWDRWKNLLATLGSPS